MYLFSHLVKNSAIWFSIYSALWIRPIGQVRFSLAILTKGTMFLGTLLAARLALNRFDICGSINEQQSDQQTFTCYQIRRFFADLAIFRSPISQTFLVWQFVKFEQNSGKLSLGHF